MLPRSWRRAMSVSSRTEMGRPRGGDRCSRRGRDALPPRATRAWALPRREAVPLLIVLALTLIGGLLRRYHLGQQSLWFDEADLVMRAREPLGSLLRNFVQPGENGPLYT